MPIYEYLCETCDHKFEVKQKFSDPPVDTCVKCGKSVRKLISAPGIMFKGSGWYVTDYSDKLKDPSQSSSGKGTDVSKDTSKGQSDSSATKSGAESGSSTTTASGDSGNSGSKKESGSSSSSSTSSSSSSTPASKPSSS